MTRRSYKIKGPFPPNFEAVLTMLRNRGFQQDPYLADQKGTFTNLVKPLPNGSRIHVQVRKGSKKIQIESHIDDYDPARNPIGHLFEDRKSHSIIKIKKGK